MKVIDLLNKIANGEEIPNKIKVNEYNYIYAPNIDYINEDNNYLMDIIELNENELNTQIEIIEDKKIPEKLESYISCGWNGTCKDLKREELFNDLKKIGNKINEIIDYLKEKE